MNMKKMKKEQIEQLRLQAIAGNELRMKQIQLFLDQLELNNDVNKTVALELASAIGFIQKDTDELKALKSSGDKNA